MIVKEKQILCKECGQPIPLKENVAALKCRYCGTEYEYSPEMRVITKLVFEKINRSPFEYELRGNVVIGRDSGKGYVEIRSDEVGSLNENTYIRNPFISRDHCKITTEGQCIILTKGGSKRVVAKLRCLIKDLDSMWGTMVNGVFAKPNEARELNPNDRVVLAPKSDLPLIFVYKEMI